VSGNLLSFVDPLEFDIDDDAAVGGTLSCALVGCFDRRDIEVPLMEARADLAVFSQPRCLTKDVTVMLATFTRQQREQSEDSRIRGGAE
jgi:hypothetical protein